MQNRVQRGFTLLEMSVVITIIGLIIGGILFGRAMLTNSRLQTVITDYDSYLTAVGNFRQTYQALPGDMANATTMWGTDSSGCPNGGGTSGTCNGNGDGMIADAAGTAKEGFRFWQHLYLAKLFNQKLSGVKGPNGIYNVVIGTNSPAGAIEGTGYWIAYWGTVSGDINRFDGFYGHILMLGGTTNAYAPNGIPNGAMFTPEQAANMDAKIDDGVPATGKLRTYGGAGATWINPNCTTSATATATYNLTTTSPQCALIFITGF